MSFTPEKTADSAVNCASNALAISRARVVLPEPGGPHRIIECGFPDSKATRSGLPGPSRCCCPTTSSMLCGRSASASGAAGSARPNRSLNEARSRLAQHVGARRGLEAELAGIDLRVALEVREAQQRGLAEVIGELHRLQAIGAEAHAHPLEARLALAWPRLHPFQAVAAAALGELECLLDLGAARQQGRRGGAERSGQLAHSDLVQIAVVDPDPLAVADDELIVRLGIGPAELARPLENEAAFRLLHRPAGLVGHLLLEARARRLGAARKFAEAINGGGLRDTGGQQSE